jgi:hypothetical protein
MLTRKNILAGCRFRLPRSFLAKHGLITGVVAGLLFAFQPNLHAQSSPLTVVPSSGFVEVGTTQPNTFLHIKANSPSAIARIEQTATTGGAGLSIVQSGSATPRDWRVTTTQFGGFKFHDATLGLDRVLIDTSGRMGIVVRILLTDLVSTSREPVVMASCCMILPCGS